MIAVFRRDELRTHSFWWFQTLGWGCFYLFSVLVVLPYIRQPGELGYRDLQGLLADQGLMCVCGFLASLGLRPVCRSLVRRSLPWIALEIRAAAWSSAMGTAMAVAASRVILATPEPMEVLELCARSSVLLFLWCNLYFSIKQSQLHEQQRERLLRAEAETHEARLRALRYQLNPHFLFNSMNAVSTLVAEGKAPAATRMLAQIAEFLRTTLDAEAVVQVPLSQEMALTQRYLAIEQTRLGGRLRVHFANAPETLDALVPSLLLQPLVENAVRHGIARLVEGGTILVQSELVQSDLVDSRVHITVSNSGPDGNGSHRLTASQARGIGLSNTAERLKTLYGTAHKFAIEWPASGGCRVVVELPFRTSGQTVGVPACA
jgi:two-component system LytT family sensor kinase